MFADDSNRRNSDPSRGLERISIGEDTGAGVGGGATGALGADGSFAASGSSAELPFWPSSVDTSLPPGQSSIVQPSLASVEPESADVFGTAEASAPITPSAPADRAAHSQRLGFDGGMDGWTVSQFGGSLDGLGTVTGGSAVLREGNSFLVTLEREVVIPGDPVAIEFIYIASFDTTDPDSIKDAFEVALLDSDGYSLVGTFTAQRDAYFNLTEDLPAALGEGVAHTAVSQGHQVTLDISNAPSGTEATLTFRLVNNDTDTETTVTILSVDITSQATPPSVTIGLLNDTAPEGPGSEPYRTDLLTNDPTVTGTAADDEAVVQLEAQVNDGPFVDITAMLIGDTYTFDAGPLPPGRRPADLLAAVRAPVHDRRSHHRPSQLAARRIRPGRPPHHPARPRRPRRQRRTTLPAVRHRNATESPAVLRQPAGDGGDGLHGRRSYLPLRCSGHRPRP